MVRIDTISTTLGVFPDVFADVSPLAAGGDCERQRHLDAAVGDRDRGVLDAAGEQLAKVRRHIHFGERDTRRVADAYVAEVNRRPRKDSGAGTPDLYGLAEERGGLLLDRAAQSITGEEPVHEPRGAQHHHDDREYPGTTEACA